MRQIMTQTDGVVKYILTLIRTLPKDTLVDGQ